MSFIDYNFFPILFFLGWNILTTKQFRPTIYKISNLQTSPKLSVFSLTDSGFASRFTPSEAVGWNPIKVLQADLKGQKRNDILQFVPGFQFLSTSSLKNKTRDASVFSKKSTDACLLNREANSIKYIAKPTERFRLRLALHSKRGRGMEPNIWLTDERKKHYFTNQNFFNKNWKANFKSAFFDFTYRSKSEFVLSSFFPNDYKIKPLFIRIEPSLNLARNGLTDLNRFGHSSLSNDKLECAFVLKNRSVNTNMSQFLNRFGFHPIASPILSSFENERPGTKQQAKLKNGIFFRGLCSSKNNSFFWKKTKKQLSEFFNLISYPQANSSLGSSFFTIKANTKKINAINFIQKRRSKVRFLLRIPTQKIYSLNKFQIALCFSKILQPDILFNDNFHFKSTSSFSNKFENGNEFMLKDVINKESPKIYDSTFNYIKDKFEPQTRVSETGFLDNVFAESSPEASYVYNYKRRKKRYMKTQFFQHVAWNMKHKMLNRFSDLEYLFHTTGLPVVINSQSKLEDPYTKSSKMASYQEKQHFSTNHNNIKIEKTDLKTIPFSNETKNYNLSINRKNQESVLQNRFSERPQKDSFLKTHKFCENSNLIIYGGSWYYENLAFPYSIFNTLPVITSSPLQSKSTLGSDFRFTPRLRLETEAKIGETVGWNPNPIALQTTHINNNQKPQDISLSAKLHRKLESDIGIYSLAHKLSSVGFRNGNSEMDIYPFKYNDSYRYNFQNMNLSNHPFKYFLGRSGLGNQTKDTSFFSQASPRDSLQAKPWTETPTENTNATEGTRFSNYRKFLDFQNPSFSNIYAPLFQPQGLNLLSFIYNSFLQIIPNSIIKPPSSAFFSSSRETKETINFSLSNQISSIINEYPHYSKNYKKIDRPFKTLPSINETTQGRPRITLQAKPWSETQLKTFNAIHHKLPIDGIHTNPYPWITQNASDRWSESNRLFTLSDSSFLGFSETKPEYQEANVLLKKKFIPTTQASPVASFQAKPWAETQLTNSSKGPFFLASAFSRENSNPSVFKTSLKTDAPMALPKQQLKNPNSQLYFTEKPSCIKKPSIFFSSFRHLPYFFISETRSTKNEIFPQANLSLFPLFGSDPNKNASHSFSVPDVTLFHRNILKQNEKKRVIEPWKSYLQQHKSFSLKPLSTFLKKETGYQTSLFSRKISGFASRFSPSEAVGWNSSQSPERKKNFFRKSFPIEKIFNKDVLFVPSFFKTKKADLPFIQKNTWKVFPPLFQPLTFRFIDLNLPRTWSSELLTSTFNSMPKNTKFLNGFENTKTNKKQDSITSDILGSLKKRRFKVKRQTEPNTLSQTKKWNMTQKNFFCFPIPFYFSDFFRFSASLGSRNNQKMRLYDHDLDIESLNRNNEFGIKSTLPINNHKNENIRFYEESRFPLTDFFKVDESKQQWNNSQKFEKTNRRSLINKTPKFQNSKIIVYGEKPLLKNRTIHGPPLKNQKESISLPSYLKNITNQNYQNLCPNNLNELYSVFWILFNKTLFIYLSLHYLRKFISFLGTEYIRNLFKIFVTMKFIDGNILSIIKTFQDFNFQLNQQNVIDIKVNNQLKNIKRN